MREMLVRLRAIIDDAVRAVEEMERGDDLSRRRGGRALREAMARAEVVVSEMNRGGGRTIADWRELGELLVELVRVAARAQGEEWRRMKMKRGADVS
jgi:hypothetical protein